MVWDAQLLQPNAHRKASIQREPYEGTHFMGSTKMPQPCNNILLQSQKVFKFNNELERLRNGLLPLLIRFCIPSLNYNQKRE